SIAIRPKSSARVVLECAASEGSHRMGASANPIAQTGGLNARDAAVSRDQVAAVGECPGSIAPRPGCGVQAIEVVVRVVLGAVGVNVQVLAILRVVLASDVEGLSVDRMMHDRDAPPLIVLVLDLAPLVLDGYKLPAVKRVAGIARASVPRMDDLWFAIVVPV